MIAPSGSQPIRQIPDMNDASRQWFGSPAVLAMQKQRGYLAAESLPEGKHAFHDRNDWSQLLRSYALHALG